MQIAGADSTNDISELIVLCDGNGFIRFVSRAFAEYFGARVENWLGKPFAPGGEAAAPGAPAAYRTKAHAGGRELVIDWRETVLGGGERLYVGAPCGEFEGADDGGANPAQAAAQNAQDSAEKESEADPKLRLLATMSHEMRTPLNGILGMNGLLLNTALEPNQRAYAESVRESGVALLALINDLLDYSKIEAGKLELDQSPFSPCALVQSVAELLSPRAADKGIEITAYVDQNIPRKLLGDEARLRQVLINLAGNGVKFTDTGGVSIEARLVRQFDGGARIAFDIRDTGIGIPADMQASIFEEFAQADSGAERKKEGTGLGLSIARKIVRAMDGDISLESAAGTGSVFTFEVEIDCEEELEQSRPPITAPVIIATRSAVLARSLELQLGAIGAESVITVISAADAHRAIAEFPGATLLCDIYLASDASSSLASAAKKSFVLLSPLARDRLDELQAEGFNGYFIKPIRQASLHEQLTSNVTAQKPSAAPAKTAPPPGRTYNILLAEDNQINAVLATAIIKRSGHNVDIARNGAEAVDAVQRKNYDLVLMDMHMPELDGLEAARQIRNLDAEISGIPIVALTANAMASDRQKCIAAGMDDFLSKPFEPADLTGIVDKWANAASELTQAS